MLRRCLALLPAVALLAGCSASRFVPAGSWMLDDVSVESDTKELHPGQFEPYVRQKGNAKWFSLLKLPLGVYSLAGSDTTKWLNRTLRNIGEAPVLFDSAQAERTCADLAEVMHGMGYVKGTADYAVEHGRKKKVDVVYTLHPGPRYHVDSIACDIQDEAIAALLDSLGYSPQRIRPGMPFVVSELDAEREHVTDLLNNNGYFNFHKDFITFSADTLSGSMGVDLTLSLHKYLRGGDTEESPHRRYTIGDVTFSASGGDEKIPLRRGVLWENTLIEPGRPYDAEALQKTYNRFGRLQIVKYTNIKFSERPDSNVLDCNIGISTNKINSISFQPEGTNTAGDLGAAASLTYENRNIFRGAETFSVKLRGAFEAITGLEGYQNQDYEEYSLEARLTFPRFLVPFLSREYRRRSTAVSELSASYNMQNRPEFHRRVFTAASERVESLEPAQSKHDPKAFLQNYAQFFQILGGKIDNAIEKTDPATLETLSDYWADRSTSRFSDVIMGASNMNAQLIATGWLGSKVAVKARDMQLDSFVAMYLAPGMKSGQQS